jgi:ferric-dicitrate binding protein FerR (iron transport regulator)
MNTQEARTFIARFVSGGYTPGEYEAFLRWLDEAPTDEIDAVMVAYEALQELWPVASGPSSIWIDRMEQKLDIEDAKGGLAPVRRIGLRKPVKRWLWAAAASVGIVLSVSAYLYVHRSDPEHRLFGGSSQNKTETLSIMSAPRGQQRQFLLADGSKVWLNSASALTYPLVFSGKERAVELSGEAYFEVAPNAASPFFVKSGDMQVEVLGTHFNMKVYADEAISKISLLEGSVKISVGSEAAILRPGEEVQVSHPVQGNGVPAILQLVAGIDPESVLAWKGGYMKFNNDDLQTVMREIGRCYGLDIQYAGKIPERHFTGKFSRDEDINQILKILELQHVHFKINGKIITVMP